MSFVFQLSPSDKTITTEWETDLNEAKDYVRKLNIISTNKDKEQEMEVDKEEPEVCENAPFVSLKIL